MVGSVSIRNGVFLGGDVTGKTLFGLLKVIILNTYIE